MKAMTLFMKFAGGLLTVYSVVVLAAWLGQRRLMYVPDRQRYAPESVGLPIARERELVAPDGARLAVWHVPPQPGQPIFLYFHGNAGGLATRADRIARYAAKGIGMFMMSYRGYSGSTGSPSEAANVADALLAYDTLIQEGVPASDIFVYGESLGSGVAVQLAADRAIGGLVMDAPYTSMLDMAVRTYPILPVRPLLADRYESHRHITRLKAPLLVIHGARDTLIPVSMGMALHAVAPGKKEIVILPEGGHSDLDSHGAVDVVARWVGNIRSAR